jgi:hypothetical protein
MEKKSRVRQQAAMPRNPQKAHVFVYPTDSGYAVSPGTFIAYRMDAPHRLRNLTSEPLDITFCGAGIGPFRVQANGTVELLGLDTLPAGIYEYEVTAQVGRILTLHAIGNSPPRVIVDP